MHIPSEDTGWAGAPEEDYKNNAPQLSKDNWGSFVPPKAVKVIYKGATYTCLLYTSPSPRDRG